MQHAHLVHELEQVSHHALLRQLQYFLRLTAVDARGELSGGSLPRLQRGEDLRFALQAVFG